ncbi:MAG: hypothetical protein RL033_2215 [Pseudomonadota bacterium]|jgi:signal transduction histidine kinase/ActR/RegA family two-component response regulator
MQSAVPSELRPSGIEGLEDLPWGAHFCHFFRDAEDLGETLVHFFGAGIAADEQCVWLVDEALPAAMARRWLRLLPDGRELEAQGRIEIVDWAEGGESRRLGVKALVDACLERESRALAAGHAGLRLAGSALATTAINRSAVRAKLSTGLSGHKVLALCGHWLQSCSADDVLEALEQSGSALVRDRARGGRIVRSEPPGPPHSDPLSSGVSVSGASTRSAAASSAPGSSAPGSSAPGSGATSTVREDEEAPAASERRLDSLAEVALQHLARLQRVSSVLSEAVSLSDVCQVLRSDMVEAVTARRAYLALASEDEGVLASIADSGAGADQESAHEARAALAPEAVCGGEQGEGEGAEPSSATRALLDQAYQERRPLWPTRPSRLVALPLRLGPRTLGAVAFELRQSRELEPDERALFEDLVRPLALALDRARLYELARQERDRAEEANQAKDEFLAVLGHELRNPLAPILTALELMRTRAGDVALRERGVIERQLNHMVRLVDDLLDVARITRGSLRLSRTRVELAEVVDRAVEMASPMLDARGHRLTLAVPRQGLLVDIDFHRVAQALGNLLMNSAKYTSRGGRIELGAHRAGERVVLEVRDDGIGIEPELLQRIFEPFVQRKQAIDRSHGGLGLGLTIARRLVELHGGSMTAVSAGSGQGSTFTIELNLVTQGERSPSTELAPAANAEVASAEDAIRVLVVDDNVDAAEMLAETLRIQGHHVGVAHDGPAALALVEQFEPDLALLDIGLPVMDGFDLAQRLKRRLSAHPPKFIAVTGYGQPSDRVRSKQAGFDEHLVKPIDLARLKAIVSSVVATQVAPSVG